MTESPSALVEAVEILVLDIGLQNWLGGSVRKEK